MISAISYAFIYLFQAFILYIYFENTLTEKKKPAFYILLTLAVWAAQYGVSFFELPILNITTFIATIFLVAYLGYGAKIRSCVFHVCILTFFMMGTEFLMMIASVSILNVDFGAHRQLIAQASISKLLFFVSTYFASKIRKKHAVDLESIPILLSLSVFPVASILFLLFVYDALSSQESHPITIGLSIGTVLLLLSNMVVFFIYEITRRTHIKNIQLQLEQQREKISAEYYELLFEKQESQKILIHDVKRHLQAIHTMAATAKPAEIERYTAELCREFGLSDAIAYSGNRYVDVIINRYVQACKAKSIAFETDVCDTSLDFMSDTDITALLDNLLENAVEAVEPASKKHIILSLYDYNQNYVVIKTQNSCDNAPRVRNGKILSSKKDVQAHGIGLKSIYRIAAKYNGVVEWKYCAETAVFEIVVIMDKSMER